ncbi:complement C3-like [Narcine bancroftii]|uniref:complement C3-like n=1 Tax=Narcine bancroftii TaxID=1343680 RepID=UPI003831D6E9
MDAGVLVTVHPHQQLFLGTHTYIRHPELLEDHRLEEIIVGAPSLSLFPINTTCHSQVLRPRSSPTKSEVATCWLWPEPQPLHGAGDTTPEELLVSGKATIDLAGGGGSVQASRRYSAGHTRPGGANSDQRLGPEPFIEGRGKSRFLVTVPSVAYVGLDLTLTLQVCETLSEVSATIQFEMQTRNMLILPRQSIVELGQRNNFTQIVHMQAPHRKTPYLDSLRREYFVTVVAKIVSPFYMTKRSSIRLIPPPIFIYIMTDKSIYTPDETVGYQIFTLDQEMRPKSTKVAVELLDSKGTVLSTLRQNEYHSIHTGEINIGVELDDMYQIRARASENFDYYGMKKFQIQRYESPRFYLQIIPDHCYYVVNSSTFSFTIQVANNVHSILNVTVRFGISLVSGHKVPLPRLDQHLQVRNGSERVVLQSNGLLQNLKEAGKLDSFIGSTFYIEAEVSDGERSERKVLDNLPFRLSHYRISFTSMKRFFTPGVQFYVPISVTYPNGSLAINVPVRVHITILEDQIVEDSIEGLTDKLGEMSLSFIVPRKAQAINITATAGNESTGIEKRRAELTRLRSDSGRSLHISVPQVLLYPGDVITVSLTALGLLESDGVRNFYYMVLGNNQMLNAGRVRRPYTSFEVHLTRAMVPTFHLVAYYVLDSKEVIADSVRLRVENLCNIQFQVKPTFHLDRDTPFHLKVTSYSSAQIFVQATDARLRAVCDHNSITPRRVFEDLYSTTIGSSSGGEQNAADVFKGSGLTFLSNLMAPFHEPVVSQSTWTRESSWGSVSQSTWKRESSWGSDRRSAVVTITQKDVGPRRHDAGLVEPTFKGSSVWMLDVTRRIKTFRLASVDRPPKFWEIQALSMSKEDGLCVAKRTVIQTDGVWTAEPGHHHKRSSHDQMDTAGK